MGRSSLGPAFHLGSSPLLGTARGNTWRDASAETLANRTRHAASTKPDDYLRPSPLPVLQGNGPLGGTSGCKVATAAPTHQDPLPKEAGAAVAVAPNLREQRLVAPLARVVGEVERRARELLERVLHLGLALLFRRGGQVVEEGERAPRRRVGGGGGGLTPPVSWGTLPLNATLQAELSWVQSHRLDVVEELPGGATIVHLDRAREPAPSMGALGWLETSIRSYAKYVDIVARSLTTAQDEREHQRRERMRIEDVEQLIAETWGQGE